MANISEGALNFHQLMMWNVAVEKARARVLDAELCKCRAPKAIGRAVDEFDRPAPKGTVARDVIEHFDDSQGAQAAC